MKKSKRQSRRESPAPSAFVVPEAAKKTAGSPFEFNPDYSNVVKDLRRIAILAGTFIVILVVLSFFLG